MIDNRVVTEAIEYILLHIWDNCTLESVAEHCHMSVSYLSTIFKQQTGESVYAFIKRVKMEQSALKLKMETDRSITEIGEDYGYSASNYSSAFRQYHKKAPSAFRNEIENDPERNQAIIERINKKIRIEDRTDQVVVFERTIGNYTDLKNAWCRFTDQYKDDITEHTIFYERTFDDPTITEKDRCIYDICMSTDTPEKYENTCILTGGKFAVYPYQGYIKGIFQVHQELIRIWFPANHYELDERYCYDQYKRLDPDGYMEFDICIPIR